MSEALARGGMMFFSCLKICLTRKYADFHSRAGRTEYLSFIGLCFMLPFLFDILTLMWPFLLPSLWEQMFLLFRYIYGGTALLLFIPFCAVHARRMHDMNHSALRCAGMLGLILLVHYSMLLMQATHGSRPVSALDLANDFFSLVVYGIPLLLLGVSRELLGLLYQQPEMFSEIRIYRSAIMLAVFGVAFYIMRRRGTEGENRFGPAPADVGGAENDIVFSVMRCLGRGYARFSGRASRSEYWGFALAHFILCAAWTPGRLALQQYLQHWAVLNGLYIPIWKDGLAVFLAVLPPLLLFVPSLSVLIRRLHDRGKSGYWLLGLLCAQALILLVVDGIFDLSMSSMSLYRHARAGRQLFFVGLLFVLLPALSFLYQMVCRGTKGPNAYGPDPLERGKRERPGKALLS